MAIRRWLPIAALVLLTAGCADDRPTSDASRSAVATPSTSPRTTLTMPTTTLPDLTDSVGLAASIRQFREDEVAGVVQVELVRAPAADAPDDPSAPPTDLVAVTSVRLDWPGFERVEATVRSVAVAPGQRVDVPTPLGAVVCDAARTPSYSAGAVEVTVAIGETTRTVRAPLLADAQTALDNVWGKGCVRQRLVDAVGLSYGTWTRTDPGGVPTATGTLVVRRGTTDAEIAVTGVDGSVLLFVNAASSLADAVLPPSGATVEVPIVVTGAGRCDGHALSDSKKTYIFQAQIRVGNDPAVGIDLPVPDADRPLLNQVIVDTCGSDHRR